MKVPSCCSLRPHLPHLLQCAGVGGGDGPGRQVPRPPQQQHQLHHLLPGREPVQICPPVNSHTVRQPTGDMIGLKPTLKADHDQITKMIVHYLYLMCTVILLLLHCQSANTSFPEQ